MSARLLAFVCAGGAGDEPDFASLLGGRGALRFGAAECCCRPSNCGAAHPAPHLAVLQVRLPLNSLPCTYKYGIRRVDGSLHLEAGENRMVVLPANDGARAPALVVRFDGCFRRQQRWRGAGIAVPLFSLKT